MLDNRTNCPTIHPTTLGRGEYVKAGKLLVLTTGVGFELELDGGALKIVDFAKFAFHVALV